jgi:Protein of unknown function (DUF3048) N-terminal domain/Protein of unknown function (DUF3048) C-terminal domain
MTRRWITLAAALAVFAAACSSDSKQAEETPPPTTARPTTTTEKRVTTTSSSTTEPETTTTVAGPTYPLTGLPATDPAVAARPAMVVKIDNHPDTRPQSGLNEADIVFEENVEHLTRFAAVFHSNVADPVGPIRSGRTQDVALLGSLNQPMFVWSGGNRRVTEAILASDLHQFNENSGLLFRVRGLAKPHNLFANVSDIYAKATPLYAPAPQPQFEYRDEGEAAKGDDIAAVKLSMDGATVQWVWDSGSGGFLRFTDGKVHKDALHDEQVSTENVVVLFVDYAPSPADRNSPEAQTLGTGEAWVYSDGKVVKGTWTRNDRLEPFTLTSTEGDTMELTPGRTFVELARSGKAATVPAGTDPADVPYP